MFKNEGVLEPVDISIKIAQILDKQINLKSLQDRIILLKELLSPKSNAVVDDRTPYFCSGCPHNSSTKVPEGSRAYAGIGCHYMALWMDRNTEGYTHMGGEGANWIGEAPFSTREHIIQNMGDGTYNHSGIMSIRASVAANVNITYKILVCFVILHHLRYRSYLFPFHNLNYSKKHLHTALQLYRIHYHRHTSIQIHLSTRS